MRFVYIGDPHGSSAGIDSRYDNYSETFLFKLKFVMDYADKNGIKTVVSGGDLFHVPIGSKNYLNIIIALLLSYKEKGIFFYTLVGNHPGDQTGKDWLSYKRKDLGTLELAGALSTSFPPELSPVHAYRFISDGTYLQEGENKAEVAVCHYFLNTGFPGDDLVIQMSDLKRIYPRLKVFCLAHDHTPYKAEIHDGVLLVAPGSLMRTSVSGSERQIYLADVDTESLKADYVEVPSQPASVVFAKDMRDVTKEAEDQMKKFVSSLKDVSVAQSEMHEYIVDYTSKVPDKEVRESLKQDFVSLGIL